MGAREKSVIAGILANLDPERDRLFRINAGTGWTGEIVKHSGDILILRKPRPLHAAPRGWPDLFGWRTVEITPDMVGQKIAVAHAVEVKAGGSSRNLTLEQRRFRDILERMGGAFEVATGNEGTDTRTDDGFASS